MTTSFPEGEIPPEVPNEQSSGYLAPGPVKVDSGRGASRWLIEWAIVVVVALLASLILRIYVIETYFIPSGSMLPTLQIGDRIVVNKLSYKLHNVERGQIVVFEKPKEITDDPQIKDLVKRVIGLPGETISSHKGMVYINGKPLSEPWLPKAVQHETVGIRTQVIPAGEYFVMGDNRTDSEDSRFFGPIKKSTIVGHAELRIWPISRIGIL